MSRDEIWKLPSGPISITFDDGPLITNKGAIQFSWYLWKNHRYYPKAPLLKRHLLTNPEVTANSHLDILSDVTWDVFVAYDYSLDREHQALLAQEGTSELFNDFTTECDRYVASISIFDFIDVMDHPDVKAANDGLRPFESSITKTHNAISKILLTDPSLSDNGVAKAARAGLAPVAQVLQCVSAIGFRTEVDSYVFKHPILTGFAQGLTLLHDVMIESRSASKALKFAKDPLRTSEYFNRKLQLVCENVKDVHIGDCGSTQHVEVLLHKNDLKNMAGKYYFTDHGYVALSRNDVNMVGKIIQMRSSLYCLHPDPSGVCSTCFGEIAFNIPKNTNLGHVSSTALGEKGSQHIMSTKHLDGTSTVDNIEVNEIDAKYIRAKDDGTTIFLSDRMAGLSVRMIIKADEARSLTDIAYTSNIRTLNIFNLTSLVDVKFSVNVGGRSEEGVVAVSMGSRHASLSHDALEYLNKKTWSLTQFGEYEIDLSEWDVNLPLLELPRKHVSVVEYVTSIEAKLLGNGSKKRGRIDLRALHNYDNPNEALFALYELVTSALDVNIAHLEIIMFAMMVRNPKNNDYNMPVGNESIVFGKFREIMTMRSLAVKMAYESQIEAFYKTESYLVTDRPAHILDDLLMG